MASLLITGLVELGLNLNWSPLPVKLWQAAFFLNLPPDVAISFRRPEPFFVAPFVLSCLLVVLLVGCLERLWDDLDNN